MKDFLIYVKISVPFALSSCHHPLGNVDSCQLNIVFTVISQFAIDRKSERVPKFISVTVVATNEYSPQSSKLKVNSMKTSEYDRKGLFSTSMHMSF